MKQKKMLTLTLSQLKQLYQQELPELCQLAGQSINDKDFRNSLERFLSLHPQAESNPGKQIRLLINYDGTNIHELSTGQDMPVQTLSVLHHVNGRLWNQRIIFQRNRFFNKKELPYTKRHTGLFIYVSGFL